MSNSIICYLLNPLILFYLSLSFSSNSYIVIDQLIHYHIFFAVIIFFVFRLNHNLIEPFDIFLLNFENLTFDSFIIIFYDYFIKFVILNNSLMIIFHMLIFVIFIHFLELLSAEMIISIFFISQSNDFVYFYPFNRLYFYKQIEVFLVIKQNDYSIVYKYDLFEFLNDFFTVFFDYINIFIFTYFIFIIF